MADPINVYAAVPSRPIGMQLASGFLHVWLDTVLNTPLAIPAYCPNCYASAASVTVGRGELPWFRIEPCTCLFEVTGP